MKLVITTLLICFSSFSFCQTGKVKIDLTITDTVQPYFLDIYTYHDRTFTSKITVNKSGTYFINHLKEGNYGFKFHSFESRSNGFYIDSVSVTNDSIIFLKVVYPTPCKFVYPKDYKPVCPFHHSDNIVPILYGYPDDDEIMEKAQKGLIRLGGCIVSDCDPQYYCTIHKLSF